MSYIKDRPSTSLKSSLSKVNNGIFFSIAVAAIIASVSFNFLPVFYFWRRAIFAAIIVIFSFTYTILNSLYKRLLTSKKSASVYPE